MAAIGNIRKHSGLLIGIIGAAMLLFVLGGALESSSVFFNGPNNEIGEINGNKISYQDFEIKVAELEANSKNGLTDQEKQQMREQVWNNMLRNQILGNEYKELGLKVTDEELMYIIKHDGNNPSLRQYFTDPQTGQIVASYAKPDGTLNGAQVIEYLKRVVYADTENSAEALTSWNSFQENYLRKPAVDEKYSKLISNGVFITDAELRRTEMDNQSTINFLYAAKFYNDLPSEDVEVSDADLKKYYNQHKTEPQYFQKNLTSSINFVTFPVVPSEEDKAALEEEVATLVEGFKNADSDTLFINENGDTPFNIKWLADGMFPAPYDTLIPQANEGDVIGPFLNGNKFELVKVMTKKMGPDSVKASHILIPIGNNEDSARATLDSLKLVIEANDNFGDMAKEYSTDPGSKDKGGEYDWFTEGRMVKEFNDACFEGEVGDMVIVKTQFGLHLIKIDGQTELKDKVLVGIVDNTIEASQATYEKAYNEASTFAITNDNADKFLEASDLMNRIEAPNLGPADMNVMGRPNTRQVVRWVFESKVGDVSSPFESNNEFIVALVTEVRESGILPLEIVEDQVREAVINKKKAEILMEKMNNPDIKQVAEANNTSIQPANDVPFASFSIPGLGNEQKLLGMAFSLDPGQTSQPIEGERGVYVIMVEAKNVPEEVAINEGTRDGLMGAFAGRAGYQPFEALKANSEITDNRYTFF